MIKNLVTRSLYKELYTIEVVMQKSNNVNEK